MPTEHFITRRDYQDLICMPTDPEFLSMTTSTTQTAKEHFHPQNTIAADECLKKGCSGLAFGIVQP